MKGIHYTISILTIVLFFSCCETEKKRMFTDEFDRSEVLTFWADDIIIPAYEQYVSDLQSLSDQVTIFYDDSSLEQFDLLKDNWLSAYKSWQHVSMFAIGQAETNEIRKYTNIYPSDTELIESNISSGVYNLMLPSNFDAQGFPALDYLFFGVADDAASVIAIITEDAYQQYIIDIVSNLTSLSEAVLNDWKGAYRAEFIANSGSSATASFDKMANDFMFYYEKFFRAGKLGIPAGVFSGSANGQSVEAVYSRNYSKLLFDEAFKSVQQFFNGVSFDGSTEGPSLDVYLDYVQGLTEGTDLKKAINDQWAIAASAAEEHLQDDLKALVDDDFIAVLTVYDEIQKAIVLLKVDMMKQFCVQIDYVDADGD